MSITVHAVNIGQEFKLKGTQGVDSLFPSIGSLVSVILPNLYILAGLILFALLIFGGLSLIMGAGNDNPQQAAKGKQAVTAAFVGFLIIFASYWIIQIIEKITGLNILNPGI